jgi:hypothetical protein
MTKSFRLAALTVAATLLFATSLVAQSTQCLGGVNLRFVGAGSSAQTNSLAYAAAALLNTAHGAYGLISFKGSVITDNRANKTDSGLTTWVAWDPSTVATNVCDAYIYFQTDSGVGVKDFFAYQKYTATAGPNSGKIFSSVAGAYGTLPSEPIAKADLIPGLPDNSSDPNGVPSNLWTALNNTPENQVNSNSAPATYCGNVSSVSALTKFWCYFNAAGTDVRPEDALYATTRGLTSYNGIVPPATHGGTGLTGLGYSNSTGANEVGCTPVSSLIGCGIYDSFSNGGGSSALFNVVSFKLSGTDPISSGTLPSYTTLSVGASPVVVLAGNEDTSNLGHTYTDSSNNINYTYNDINRQILAQVFSGYTACIGDIQSSTAVVSGGAGVPLQVIHREPLSGTYNTFEFTGVRTQAAGPLLETATPNANADSGQEQFNDPNVFGGLFGGTLACTSGGSYGGHSVAANVPQGNCFDPLFLSNQGGGTDIVVGKNCTGSTTGAPGIPVRLRAIGTGEEVKAVIGSFNTFTQSGSTVSAGLATVYNPVGYAFWSFGNLNPLCSGASGTSCTGTWLGHYLTVDGIDPLFATEGGEFDGNPSGPYNPPVCQFAAGVIVQTCPTIPFAHLKDGKYPLWSLLRTVTFAPVSGKYSTPTGVLDMIANEEITSANNNLSDYVPFLSGVTGSNGVYTGNLNLFVYRSHFKQTGGTVNPANGHKGCSSFTGVSLQGGTSGHTTCLVDFGNDVGGSVLTVQSDVEFNADFGTEEYGLRQ